MKRMIFIVVLMSFVASGALTGLIVLDIIPNPFADSERDMAESGGEEGGEAGGGGTPSFVPPERALILMPLEDIVIPVIIDARVIKRVYITARMEIARGNRSAVENGLSRMESALNENLMVYFQEHFAQNRRIDLRGVKRMMVRSSKQVYGDMVDDVLLLTVFEQ